MWSEEQLIHALKESGLLPKDAPSKFKEVVGIVKWEDPSIKALIEKAGFQFCDKLPEPQEDLVSKVPLSFMRRERLVPVKESALEVEVATDNPYNTQGLEKLEWMLSKPVKVTVVPFDQLNMFLTEDTLTQEQEEFEDVSGEDILTSVEEAPIVQLVNDILLTAVRVRASDIHFEPFRDRMRVRLRVDGVLKTLREIPLSKVPAVISRLKIMANLDIAEKRLPQDGRIMVRVGGKEIDIRVSTLPVYSGERVVLRLLSKESILYSTKELGLLEDDYRVFERLIHTPHGIILVTGPTGSGKTTTLYAALSEINREEVNIITVEDPVEYQLQGISQVPVKPDIGFTFATALRSILRQDPDIIMIGEIRDLETAEIAIQSALTGHLVFSTLHTNDSATSVTRLLEMGIERFLVASSVTAVIAQRLVRKVCPYCKEEYVPFSEELKELGIEGSVQTLWRGRGCENCMNTGYLGRTAIYEILVVTKQVRRAILEGRDADEIKAIAVKSGMKTLKMDGARKVKMGITTPEEVLRVTRG
jgi:type II secretion system protein E